MHILAADALALEGGGIGDGDIDVRDRHFDSPDFDAAGYQFFVVEFVNDMFIGADAGRQDLGNIGVGNNGEAHVYRTSAGGIFKVVNLSEGEPEGKYPVLAVFEALSRLARFQAAEGHCRSNCPIQGIDAADRVPAVRYDVGIPSHFDFFFSKLVDNAPAVGRRTCKHHDAPFLEIANYRDSGFIVRRCSKNGGQPGHPAVHKLNAECTKDSVCEKSVAAGLRLFIIEVTQGGDDFLGKKP